MHMSYKYDDSNVLATVGLQPDADELLREGCLADGKSNRCLHRHPYRKEIGFKLFATPAVYLRPRVPF